MLALQIALGFGIAILMPMMSYYATCAFFPQLAVQRNNFSTALQKRLFYVSCSVGFLALALGPLLSSRPVGAGLMFGGIFCIVEGVGCNWPNLHAKAKFAFLLSALAALITIGFRYLS